MQGLKISARALFAGLMAALSLTGPGGPLAAESREAASSKSRPAASARVWMLPRVVKAQVGHRVSIKVRVANAAELGSAPFHVLYDPKVLKFEGGEEGPFMKSGGRQTAFFAAPTSDGNEVVVGLSRLGRGNGAAGQGLLCTLNFTALARGDAKLTFSRAKLRSSENEIVPSAFKAARIIVR